MALSASIPDARGGSWTGYPNLILEDSERQDALLG
jgi:hypothetical protein